MQAYNNYPFASNSLSKHQSHPFLLKILSQSRRKSPERGSEKLVQKRRELCGKWKLGKTEIEQNRCAMACQGCGAVFLFLQK